MTADARIHDLAARNRAATDFETNLVVEAGAGTGKTSLLVERALNAVGSGLAPMDGIAAITFTEKAAGEMRVRLAGGLDRLRRLALCEIEADESDEAGRAFAHLDQEVDSNERIAERALQAMERLDRATVVTIHGFCSELLRAHPVEAGVDPGFIVDDGQHAERLRQEAWDRFVAKELGPEAPRVDAWKALLSEIPLAAIGKLARGLADFGFPEALLRPPFAFPDARDLFANEIVSLIDGIGAMLAAQKGLTSKARIYFEGMLRSLETLRDGGTEAFARQMEEEGDLAERIEHGKHPRTRYKKLTGVDPDRVVELSAQSRDLARLLCRASDAWMVSLLEIVAPYAVDFREEYLREGFVSFDGLLNLTRDLLRDRPEVRERLKRRFRYLLVDEFQDTDPVQYEIVLLLAEEPEGRATDPYEATLSPGKLFVVGDAKQSVYRFRGADYAAYRRAIDRIRDSGGERLDLITNFRSVPGVLGPVNALLEDARGSWSPSPGYQPEYVPILPARGQEDEAPRVELWTVDLPGGASAGERREAEGRAIALEIERLVEDGACEYHEITILFRAFTNISYYLRSLRERGIPFVVDGGREFLKRPEVGQLMATLQTLAQPSDEPALLAFLRSPAGGLSDRQLSGYAADGGRWDWRTAAGGKRHPDVARCYALLRGLAEETRDLPADAVVRRVLERTHALPLGAAAFEGAQRVANMRKLAAAAGDLARDGRLSLEEVVSALREGRLADIETDRPLADDAERAVRITSIHRMKGLENDRIFLPDLARQEHRGGWEKEPAAVAHLPGCGATLALNVRGAWNSAQAWLDHEDRQHDRSEEVRVLYVALTRARERLVVVAGPSRGTAPWVEALSPWGYDAGAPPADGVTIAGGAVLHRRPEVKRGGGETAEEVSSDVAAAVERYAEAMERARRNSRPPIGSPSGLYEEREAARAESGPPRAHSRDVAKAAGIVIHRLLEIAADEGAQFQRRQLEALCAEVARTNEVDPSALLRESREILERFLDSPLAQELRDVKCLGRELPVLLRRDDGRLFHGSIDLLYEAEDGRIVVADYKTDRASKDDELRERYRDQLEIYADAVRLAMNLDERPAVELWLLREGRRVAQFR